MNKELFKNVLQCTDPELFGLQIARETINGLIFTRGMPFAKDAYNITNSSGETLASTIIDYNIFIVTDKQSQIIFKEIIENLHNVFYDDAERLKYLTKAAESVKKYYEQRI